MFKREKRICYQCGKVEPGPLVLIISPSKMFKIWRGAAHIHNFCTFECSLAYTNGEPNYQGLNDNVVNGG